MLSEIARELYFHPPDHAAEVINILFADIHSFIFSGINCFIRNISIYDIYVVKVVM